MNIQIFGRNKCFDTKKAQRYFSERKIKFQFINLDEKDMSPKEFDSVKNAVKGIENMVNENCKKKDLYSLYKYTPDSLKENKLFENQELLLTPIVRNGNKATIGYKPDIWKIWE